MRCSERCPYVSLEYSNYLQTQTPFAVDLTQRLLFSAFGMGQSAVRLLEKKTFRVNFNCYEIESNYSQTLFMLALKFRMTLFGDLAILLLGFQYSVIVNESYRHVK